MHVRDLCGLSLWGSTTYSQINFSIKSHVQLQTFASSTTVESINHCFFHSLEEKVLHVEII